MLFNKKNNKVFYLVSIIILVLFFSFALRPIRSFLHSVSHPLQGWFWSKGLESSGFWSGVFNAERLRAENDDLRNRNQLFLNKIIELNQLKDENQRLRKVLGLGLTEDFNLLETNILSKNIMKDFIVIDKGTKNNVHEEMAVINYQKILVGRIDEVYKSSSRVRLLTDKNMKFGVQILDTDIKALARGQGNQKMILDLISKNEKVLSDTLIITGLPVRIVPQDNATVDDLEIGFPSGLLVGKINQVEKSDLTPFQQVKADPLFNIQRAELLFVIVD